MNKINSLYKMTPSATEMLAETISEFNDLLIERANFRAKENRSPNLEISLQDVLEAKYEIFSNQEVRLLQQESTQMKRSITASGTLIALIGILYFLYENSDFSYNGKMGLLLCFSGVFSIIIGNLLIYLLKKPIDKNIQNGMYNYQYSNKDYEVIQKWYLIEKLSKNIMAKEYSIPPESITMSALINFISNEAQKMDIDLGMKEILSTRNKIVHEDYELDDKERSEYLHEAEVIIQVLETIESNKRMN